MAGELATQQQNKGVQTQKDTISVLLSQEQIKKRFEQVLGKKAAGFMSSVISAVNSNPKLKQANPMTVVASAAVAASLDLPINPSLGFAYIVPYGGEAQFQLGYKGFIQLGMRTGQYKTINVAAVHEGELVSNNPFTGDMEFDVNSRTSDKIIGYVAYFRLINGFEKYLYMTAEETKAHGKRYSKNFSRETSKWQTDFNAMSMKTVLKMLMSKYGILSIEMQTAVMADQAVVKEIDGDYEYPDNPEDIIEGEEVKQLTNGNEALKAKLKGKKEETIVDAVITEPELSPVPCPDDPETTYTKEHCDKCEKRSGCPVWP